MQTRLCVMSQIITKKEETFLNFPARRDGVVLVDCQSSIFWHKRKVPPGLSGRTNWNQKKTMNQPKKVKLAAPNP